MAKKNGVKVTFYDPVARKSVSITVYGSRLEDVARQGWRAMSGRWPTTELNSRRHKRRL